ncbi:MAG: AI-2E family transporter [Clostridia bacterium]|nr:AI-2E family transporter [Clostridia bacterium]
MEKESWQNRAAILLCIFLGGAALFLAFRYLLPLLLPFAAGALLAFSARRLAARASKKIPCALLAPLILTLLLFLLALLIRALGKRILEEGLAFLSNFSSFQSDLQASFAKVLDLFGDQESPLRASFESWLPGLLGRILEGLTALFGKILSGAPGFLLSVVVVIIVAYAFAIEGRRPWDALLERLPQKWKGYLDEKLPIFQHKTRQLSFRYLRAYLLLFLITWGELLAGFLILKVKYAFLLAFFVAFVDLLPILGTGSVLIPWGIFQFWQGNIALGAGLLILYAVITLARQFLEPHLLGKSLGLHPILTLFAGYAGWRLFGVWGMLLGPVVLILLKSLFFGSFSEIKEKRQA